VNKIQILKKLFIDSQKCQLFNDSQPTCSTTTNENNQEIVSIKPNRIPLTGGTLISLNGIKNPELCLNLTICGQLCEIKEINLNQIKCQTKGVASEQECSVNLNYINHVSQMFPHKLSYVEVKIENIKPNELIQSCKGCIIEINGKNLDAGLQRRLRIIDSSLIRTEQQNEEVFCI
jgi:hypothetical protein